MNTKSPFVVFHAFTLCALWFLLPSPSVSAAVFTNINAGLPGIYPYASVAWGDYDNDGRLDILLVGTTNQNYSGVVAQVWRNTGSGFTNINAGLPGVEGSAVWGDYDNDGRLDILLTGDTGSQNICQVWRNTGNGFTNINAGLTGTIGPAAWGDYDNDGRLDILLTGSTFSGVIAQVWRNTGSGFVNINAGLPGVQGSGAWGDYDNDGRLDILLTGQSDTGPIIAQVWRNTGSGFVNINAGLPGVYNSSGTWADYDNDGRPDILLIGNTNGFTICQIWRNTASGFTNINAVFPSSVGTAIAWGDYDNDGRLDLLLNNDVWWNTGSGFTNINVGLPAIRIAGAWGDYDNDGRLDILLAGYASSNLTQVWRNISPQTNTLPTAPTGLTVTAGSLVTFQWNAASDAETPSNGLTYNLRVGITPGGSNLLGPMAASNGLRRVPQFGNKQQSRSVPLIISNDQPIYWSVQAVDTAFAGSSFASEANFRLNSSFISPAAGPTPGDTNGDGIVNHSEFVAVLAKLNGNGSVSQADLDSVLANYWPNSPWLLMTNTAGLGKTNVQFALPYPTGWNFTVEVSTNLTGWTPLGSASPLYQFGDFAATNLPQRYYRLRYP